MIATVAGVYKNGRIELLEKPVGLRDGRVEIILTQDDAVTVPARYLVYGKYQGSKDPTLEDFKIAEWDGEAEFDHLDGK